MYRNRHFLYLILYIFDITDEKTFANIKCFFLSFGEHNKEIYNKGENTNERKRSNQGK